MVKFEGPLTDCVKNFAQKIKGDFRFRNRVCVALSINPATGHAWFNQVILPKGTNLLKLFVLLWLNGYHIKEAPQDSIKSWLSKMIAVELITIEDVAKFVGFSRGQEVLRFIFGKSGTTEEKMTKINKLIIDFRELTSEKIQEWKKAVEFKDEKTDSPAPFLPISDTVLASPATHLSHKDALEIFAHQVKAMVPLAKWIASDEFSADERRKLRQLADNGRSNEVFALSTILNRLCSETARKEM